MTSTQRIELPFLDGLRGLAALYVVLFHLLMTQDIAHHLNPVLFVGTWILRHGHFAVDVFIVLSGYCLMIPTVCAADARIPGGLRPFLIRRFKRLFPAYYAAFALSIALILLIRLTGSRVRADDGHAFDALNIVSHLFMFHNWFPRYADAINLPMWSVPVEWQIYFIFALVLLPVWRRSGMIATVVVALLLGELPRLLMPASYDLSWFRPWYIALFSFGMAATLVHFGPHGSPPWRLAERVPWGSLSLVMVVLLVIIEAIGGEARGMSALWAKDLFVGLIASAFILWCTKSSRAIVHKDGVRLPIAIRMLQSRPALFLGMVSYSLYLIHLPLMWLTKGVVQQLHLRDYGEFAFRMTLVPLAMLPVAYAFFCVFERPFMSRRMARRLNHEMQPTTVTPAPSAAEATALGR